MLFHTFADALAVAMDTAAKNRGLERANLMPLKVEHFDAGDDTGQEVTLGAYMMTPRGLDIVEVAKVAMIGETIDAHGSIPAYWRFEFGLGD